MSLLVLMYHRARAGRHGNAPEILDAHFAEIANRYPTVLPGDQLAPGAVNVCLTFDDGYYDFYAKVFPLLRKHKLRALLAIPPHLIGEHSDAKASDRVNIETEEAFAHPMRGGFCTWPELKEMVESQHVMVAAHGCTHQRLDLATTNFATEIDSPQTIIGFRLSRPVESFVFPFGRYSSRSLSHARQRYRYLFRIGGALNRNWGRRLLYRVDADAMASPGALFTPARLAGYRARYVWNRLRLR